MNEANDLRNGFTLELTLCAHTRAQLPQLDRPQIALAGRSNVGKSSLINALAGRKKLAKTSSTPGKTRSINFYRVLPPDYYLVDLPGYGYARASHSDRQSWSEILEDYIANCRELKAMALLLDCRLPPQKIDLGLVDYARGRGIPLLPVLTKADKCTQKERKERADEWQEILGARPLPVSAQKRLGLDKLWQLLTKAAMGPAAQEGPER